MENSVFVLITSVLAIGFLGMGYILGTLVSRKNSQIPHLQSEISILQQTLQITRQEKEQINLSNGHLLSEISGLREEKETALIRVGKLEVEKESFEVQLIAQKADLQNIQEVLRKDFELLANRIFDEKSEKFGLQNRISLDQVLEPLKFRLKEFQDKVEETHKDNIRETSGLRQEIKNLKDTSQKMSQDAENLTRALKHDSKTQGNWGEMILENILESSGLAKDREYFLQQSFTQADGRRLQPDVLIKLPENKWVVVDSKVSLTAYESFVNGADETERQLYLKNHLQSLRAHIKALVGKEYQSATEGKNLDFILMFIPIEPAYLTALNADRTLFNDAYEKGIVMVCPTTLIASLKIIATTWKYEYQNKNSQEIAERGKILLEKFISFAEDFEKIGEQVDRTGKLHAEALKKLRDGRGGLVWQAHKLQELGVKSSKRLSRELSLDKSVNAEE